MVAEGFRWDKRSRPRQERRWRILVGHRLPTTSGGGGGSHRGEQIPAKNGDDGSRLGEQTSAGSDGDEGMEWKQRGNQGVHQR